MSNITIQVKKKRVRVPISPNSSQVNAETADSKMPKQHLQSITENKQRITQREQFSNLISFLRQKTSEGKPYPKVRTFSMNKPRPSLSPTTSLPISGEEKIRAHLAQVKRERELAPLPIPPTFIPLSSLSVREVLLIPLDKFPNDSEDCPPGWSYKKNAPKRREDLTEEYVRNLYRYENGILRTLGKKNVCQSREETIKYLENLWNPPPPPKPIETALDKGGPNMIGYHLRKLAKEKSLG